MNILQSPSHYEEVIRQSRFIAHAIPMSMENQFDDLFSSIALNDASHNCWAWRIGGLHRYSDDGEPGGTAGRPIFQAIETREIDQVLLVVSRYFGGVKLGTGGLIRAYGRTAAACLAQAEILPVMEKTEMSLECDFAYEAMVYRLVALHGGDVIDLQHDAKGARFELSFNAGEEAAFARDLREQSAGRVCVDEDIRGGGKTADW